jgi:hypothetical protein
MTETEIASENKPPDIIVIARILEKLSATVRDRGISLG